ncbi:hypothetical protein NCAS_0I01240 [Naumovozyma castellii]|uniref:Survival protein SurE-like phosphatase/nucleotidase domain-containing protein n=1 Tax=Naumovozyma castellii TaxID=27288 RepID=G0VJW0_NAUCA|nr:hypothetical protein NCAS_0I01240 [Naumovozyma castellii CBS 4309]CCC71792.1 hypothetical protein NCAS_0I01240 [Naumovozyma castellii CBS 4309]
MRVLITNDDGPLHDQFSPYIRPFIQYIKSNFPEWHITVCVPNTQKSWIGKAHLAGKSLTAQFLYSKLNSQDNTFFGPFNQPQLLNSDPDSTLPRTQNNTEIPIDAIEWILLDGTPASCVNIALHHLSTKPFDLVISGPNVGRNTSAAYITSSGTVGAAMESVITSGIKSVALSWAYFQGFKIVSSELMEAASRWSVDVIRHLYDHWDADTDLYSVNVPLVDDILKLQDVQVQYTPIWENRWTSIFDKPLINQDNLNPERTTRDDIEAGEEYNTISFRWNPNFKTTRDSHHVCNDSDCDHDMKIIEKKMISVTPLRATFRTIDHLLGQKLNLNNATTSPDNTVNIAITIDPTEYIYNPLKTALIKHLPNANFVNKVEDAKDTPNSVLFQYGDYEQLDVDKLMSSPEKYFTNSYVYRKALIRKHYLSHTVHSYVVKHPESILNTAVPETYTIDLDYAEFLDDSLDENWELRQELEKEEKWWIVKPSMSDKGQGIRVFKTIEDLQAIFDSFDDEEDEAEDGTECIDDNKIIISQLRHFIIQEYMSNPLLLKSMDNKKFHIRCYVTCKGDVEVFVYDRMLALFAPTPFTPLVEDEYSPTDLTNLQCHLTNTCLQTKNENKDLSVMEFDKLEDISLEHKLSIKKEIHQITRDIILAALNVNRLNFQPLPNAFETYGVDFLVDSNFHVKFLEINAYPDFKQTGTELKGLIDELFDNTVKQCIVPLVTKNNDKCITDRNFTSVLEYKSNEW